uniref:Uncharacterized protein n=1 Tax=Amphimedon queenslandica TaxID=400682 RepID=A0A1X7VCE4_AMPQE
MVAQKYNPLTDMVAEKVTPSTDPKPVHGYFPARVLLGSSFSCGHPIKIIQPIDVPLLIYAMRNESVSKPDFYSNSFKEVVDNLLESSLGLKQEDITHSNIEDIYLYM